MNTRLVALREQLLDLPEEDRELLAYDLLDSLPHSETDHQEWDKRLNEMKTNQVKGLSIDAFFQEVRQA